MPFFTLQSEHDRLLIAQLKDEVHHATEQMETLKGQHTLLDSENKHNKQLLDSANTQIAKLKGMMSTASSNLSTLYEAKETLQNQLEAVQQQLTSAASALSHKVACFARTL